MKRLIISFIIFFVCLFSALAIPSGRYNADDGSFVIVTESYIYLFIGNYKAGAFAILEESEDGSFVFSTGDGTHKGRWYCENGHTYLIMGKRFLVKED